jgi:CheY-like chemotaxis protein
MVLCVDDDEGQAEVLADMLSFNGFETRTATSGEACLQASGRAWCRPDTADIMMSPMDGWQHVNQIRENDALCAVGAHADR